MFGVKRKQALSAKSVSEARRKSALDRGLGDMLKKARAGKEAAKKQALAKKKPATAPAKKAVPNGKAAAATGGDTASATTSGI